VVRIIQHIFLGGALVAVQLTAAKCLVQVLAFTNVDLCLVTSHAVVVVVMFPVMQVRYSQILSSLRTMDSAVAGLAHWVQVVTRAIQRQASSGVPVLTRFTG
jgi:hypothetical protein